MIKKYCWRCGEISDFEETKIEYVKSKTGGSEYTCIKCVQKWKKENNIKEVIRIDKKDTGKMFNDYEFIENEK